jgi:hypothetical protein
MTRPRHLVLVTATFAVALFAAAGAPASAQNLQSGDIVVPGVHVIDGFGNTNGCFYRLRGGVVTRLFESPSYNGPRDMVVDSQGRLVFFASPASRNSNDTALFRIDPATGVLERLFYFPYIVASGDTLPDGASSATGFYGISGQSLHLQKGFGIVIDDDVNGGWPQIQTGESYGFAMSTTMSGQAPTTYRYGAEDGVCEVGISSAPLPWTGAPYMASDDNFIYYGLNSMIGRTQAPSRVDLHLDGDWGHFDFSARVPPKNELIITGHVFDNTRYPNGHVQCGPTSDNEVPFTSDGASFSVLSMDGLGVSGGSPYITSNSGATGTPYVFSIAPRGPYLNPYACFWDTAIKGTGMLDFWLTDGTPTSCPFTSPDGGSLLGLGNGVIKRVDQGGSFQLIDSSQPYTGRPWRWHGASSPAVAVAAAAAVIDSGAQVLVVRTDALVNVLLTDALGRRLGHDASGNPVNEFGESGQVITGPGGWPRLLALRDPAAGTYSAQVAAGGAGNWSVKAYLSHARAGSLVTTTSGTSAGVGSIARGLHVGQPTELTWYTDPAGVGDPATSKGMGFVAVGPVPALGAVEIAYRVPQNGARVRLDVFDIAGRLVTTPVNDFESGGVHTLTWRGAGASGVRLANGIYFASLEVSGRRETRRIVLTN